MPIASGGTTRTVALFAVLIAVTGAALLGCSDDVAEPDDRDAGVHDDVGDVDAETDAGPPEDCSNISCEEGQTCHRASCWDTCQVSEDCEDGYRCHEARCVPTDCEGVDCPDGQACHRGACHPACDEDADCEAPEASCVDGVCLDDLCEGVDCNDDQTCYRGVCYDACDEEQDCGDDYRCWEGHHCAPVDCEGVDCPDDQTCYRGVCYGSCSTDGDCAPEIACIDDACVDPCEGVDCPDDQTCYRAACEEECTDHDDCPDDHRCGDDHCAPIDCEGVDCNDDEQCLGGLCYPQCSDDGDCTGDDEVCLDDACVEPSCEDGIITGDISCPDLLAPGVQVTNVTAETADFEGNLDAPPTTLVDHGLCWSPDPSPASSDDNCTSLGEPEQRGPFSASADDLQPAEGYYVQSYAETDDDRFTSGDVPFMTAPTAPTDIETTNAIDHVTVDWTDVDGADEYRVLRDPGTANEQLVETTSSTQVVDDGATAGDIQAPAPPNFEVSDGLDGPDLSWEAPVLEDGPQHSYAVVSVNTAGNSSAPSSGESGRRVAADIESFEVEIDGDEWIDVGDATEWQHTDAPEGAVDIDASSLSVGQAQHVDHVPLAGGEATVSPGEKLDYRVRAATLDADGETVDGAATESETGRSLAEDPVHQWEYADEPAESGDFAPVTDCDEDELDCNDTAGQPPADAYHYRLAVEADGIEGPRYGPDAMGTEGWIAVQGEVETLSVTDIGMEEATLRGDLTEVGAPEPDEQGFCYDEEPNDSPTHGDAEECLEVASPSDEPEEYDLEVDGLDEYTSYHVRAFVHTPEAEGTDYHYGNSVQFRTDPPPPECDPDASLFSGGAGSADYPYTICNSDDVNDIGPGYLDDHFLVMNDIDMEDGGSPIGSQNSPFTGEFDGDGYTIENFAVDGGDYGGFFGHIGEDGSVRDIHLESVDIDTDGRGGALAMRNKGTIRGSSASGLVDSRQSGAGGLVGSNRSEGSIYNSSSSATASGSGDWYDSFGSGGLVGSNRGSIQNSRATGDVDGDTNVGGFVGTNYGTIRRSYATGDVDADHRAGGFVGYNLCSGTCGDIHESYAVGDVESLEDAGGFVGQHASEITHSYSTGYVDGRDDTGGFVGDWRGGSTDECTFDESTSGYSSINSLTTSEFSEKDNFPEWNFDWTWEMGTAPDGNTRPILQWQD